MEFGQGGTSAMSNVHDVPEARSKAYQASQAWNSVKVGQAPCQTSMMFQKPGQRRIPFLHQGCTSGIRDLNICTSLQKKANHLSFWQVFPWVLFRVVKYPKKSLLKGCKL